MKYSVPYFRLCQGVFILACVFGVHFAMSYIDFVHGNTWAAWRPGIGIALLFASTVMSFVGYGLRVQRDRDKPVPGV